MANPVPPAPPAVPRESVAPRAAACAATSSRSPGSLTTSPVPCGCPATGPASCCTVCASSWASTPQPVGDTGGGARVAGRNGRRLLGNGHANRPDTAHASSIPVPRKLTLERLPADRPYRELHAGTQTQFGEDVRDVRLHGTPGQVQL